MFDNFTAPAESLLVNEEAEQLLLGGLIARPTAAAAWKAALGRINADDFGISAHAAIFEAVADRAENGRSTEVGLLGDLATTLAGALADIPGGAMGYLSELAMAGGQAVEFRGYVAEIAELARRRRLHAAAVDAMTAALDRSAPITETVGDLIGRAEILVDAGRGRSRREVLERLVEAVEKPTAVDATGLPKLDRAMRGGLHRGRLYAVAGAPKGGKTMLATTISYNLNEAGVRHAYVALEMGSVEIEQRQAARALRVSSMEFLGDVRDDLRRRLADYALKAESFVHYIDLPGGTMAALKDEIFAAVHRHRCHGIIVDYWQLVGGRERGVSEEEHLRRVAQWLAAVAKRLNIWVLVLAQLADDGEATAASRTGLTRAADQVFFLRGDADRDDRWLEMRASRYTPVGDVGNESAPAFKIVQPGPHVMDLSM